MSKDLFNLVNDKNKESASQLTDLQVQYIVKNLENLTPDIQSRIINKLDFFSKNILTDFNKLIKNKGYTETDLYYKGLNLIGDLMHLCRDQYCDLIMGDVRACIAFKLIFDSFKRFYERDVDKDLMYSEKFAKCYSNVDVNLFSEILKNYYIHQGEITSNCRIRKVIFVGEEKECIKICNSLYGANNWEQIKQKFTLKYKKPLPPQPELTPEEKEKEEQERQKNFNNALAELESIWNKSKN